MWTPFIALAKLEGRITRHFAAERKAEVNLPEMQMSNQKLCNGSERLRIVAHLIARLEKHQT